MCMKYRVRNATELEFVYDQFQRAKREWARKRESVYMLNEKKDILVAELKKMGVKDAEIWCTQVQAIIEPKKLGFMSQDNEKQDYERMKSGVMEEVRRLFKPEFLNRIDDIMVFHPLKKPEIRKIVNILLKNLEKRCAEQMGIQLKITDSVRDYLAESGFDSKYGARPLRRAIQNKLEDPMANEILEGRFRTGDTVKVQLHQKKICFIPVRDTE